MKQTAPNRPEIDPVNIARFRNAERRTLGTQPDCSFIRTCRPVLDDGPDRSFDTTADYRDFRTRPDDPQGPRESDAGAMIDRAVDRITSWGAADGYFRSAEDGKTFSDEIDRGLHRPLDGEEVPLRRRAARGRRQPPREPRPARSPARAAPRPPQRSPHL